MILKYHDVHANLKCQSLHSYSKGFPGGSDGKQFACSAGDLGSIPVLEDPLEKGKGTHSSILTWRIPWTEEPSELQSTGSQRVGQNWATNTHTHACYSKGNIVVLKFLTGAKAPANHFDRYQGFNSEKDRYDLSLQKVTS